MNDKLISSLRICGRINSANDNCIAFHDGSCEAEPVCMYELMGKAADAIAELRMAVNFHKFNSEFWEGKYNSLADEKWIPVAERLPSDFVSVQAHMTDAGNFPPVREAYVVNKNWFFPALKEFHPVDMWRRFDEPPEEE